MPGQGAPEKFLLRFPDANLTPGKSIEWRPVTLELPAKLILGLPEGRKFDWIKSAVVEADVVYSA